MPGAKEGSEMARPSDPYQGLFAQELRMAVRDGQAKCPIPGTRDSWPKS